MGVKLSDSDKRTFKETRATFANSISVAFDSEGPPNECAGHQLPIRRFATLLRSSVPEMTKSHSRGRRVMGAVRAMRGVTRNRRTRYVVSICNTKGEHFVTYILCNKSKLTFPVTKRTPPPPAFNTLRHDFCMNGRRRDIGKWGLSPGRSCCTQCNRGGCGGGRDHCDKIREHLVAYTSQTQTDSRPTDLK